MSGWGGGEAAWGPQGPPLKVTFPGHVIRHLRPPSLSLPHPLFSCVPPSVSFLVSRGDIHIDVFFYTHTHSQNCGGIAFSGSSAINDSKFHQSKLITSTFGIVCATILGGMLVQCLALLLHTQSRDQDSNPGSGSMRVEFAYFACCRGVSSSFSLQSKNRLRLELLNCVPLMGCCLLGYSPPCA